MSRIKRQLLIIAGTIAVVLGIIGIVFPVLPTTPFLLLAAICYTRSSSRLYNALMNNRWLGSYIKNYLQGNGMSLKSKIMTISLLWITIGCTIVFLTDNLAVRIFLLLVLAGVTAHLLSIKTLRGRDLAQPERDRFRVQP